MRIQQAFLIISLAVSTVLVGCVGRVRYPTYYTLNVPPAPDPPAAAGLRASLAIREFRSPVYLRQGPDRKSTRLNSSHANISYAVFCLKKKTDTTRRPC